MQVFIDSLLEKMFHFKSWMFRFKHLILTTEDMKKILGSGHSLTSNKSTIQVTNKGEKTATHD